MERANSVHSPPVKQDWISRALEIRKFHVEQCRDEEGWTIEKTAKLLNRSIGSVSQDLSLASWLKTHEKQLRRCRSRRDALEFVRSKQREMELEV
jgi:hypothetical protein